MKKIFTVLTAVLLLTVACSANMAFAAEVSAEQGNVVDTTQQAVEVSQQAQPEVGVVIDMKAGEAAAVVEEAPVEEAGKHHYIGHFTITHYCICARCCGKSASNPAYGITATGTRATPQRTIAVDPRVIPYGTQVIINDHIYIAEDCGGAIKQQRIDVLVGSHYEALQKGVLRNVPVYIVL